MTNDDVPLLTDRVAGPRAASPSELSELSDDARNALIAELQTRMAAECYELLESMLDDATRQVEAILYEKLKAQLRAELPEVIEAVLEDVLERAARD